MRSACMLLHMHVHVLANASQAKKLKQSFNADFSLIFQLCEYILGHSSKQSLLVCTFQVTFCLHR